MWKVIFYPNMIFNNKQDGVTHGEYLLHSKEKRRGNGRRGSRSYTGGAEGHPGSGAALPGWERSALVKIQGRRSSVISFAAFCLVHNLATFRFSGEIPIDEIAKTTQGDRGCLVGGFHCTMFCAHLWLSKNNQPTVKRRLLSNTLSQPSLT